MPEAKPESKPGVRAEADKMRPKLRAEVLHKPGAVRLDEYPRLVHAPGQWGAGIRTEDNGTAVYDIAVKAAEVQDHGRLAEHFKTTPEHVAEALRYAAASHQAAAQPPPPPPTPPPPQDPAAAPKA